MKKLKIILLLLITHGLFAVFGFGAGIYALPILTAPEAPSVEEIASVAEMATHKAQFRRDLEGSDSLHWGEGTVHIASDSISLMGRLAPGPDYKLYLSPEFVQTEAEFNRVKSVSLQVGDVKTFENFLVPISGNVNIADFNSVVIWCETFGEFITAAQYQ